MTRHPQPPSFRSFRRTRIARQRGVALFMVMMVTLIIVALSVSLATGVFGEHKLSRSSADQAIARQGAEAALRDAELDLSCKRWSAASNTFEVSNETSNPPNVREHCASSLGNLSGLRAAATVGGASAGSVGDAAAGTACVDGLRTMITVDSIGGLPAPTSLMGCSVILGTVTKQPALLLDGQGAQPSPPRYGIEVYTDTTNGSKLSSSSTITIYRIHARGYGRSTGSDVSTTTVDLEAVFRPHN
jgi:type IV pilus assembly protein PilX